MTFNPKVITGLYVMILILLLLLLNMAIGGDEPDAISEAQEIEAARGLRQSLDRLVDGLIEYLAVEDEYLGREPLAVRMRMRERNGE